MTDLYGALDLDRDATPDEVKAAHRKKARQHHPDTGDGDRDAFAVAQRAYVILKDPAKWAEYDSTGKVDDEPDNAQARTASILASAFESVFASASDVDSLDLMGGIARWFADRKAAGTEERRRVAKDQTKAKKARKRLRHKGEGTNLIGAMLDQRIAAADLALATIDRELALLEDARLLLTAYSYDFDQRGMAGNSGFFGDIDLAQISAEIVRDSHRRGDSFRFDWK